MTPLPPLLTTGEVADALSVGPDTVRRWVKDGKLAAVELPSGVLRFKRADVERILGLEPDREAGHAAPQLLARVALVLASTLAFGTALAVATARPLLVLSLLASVLVVGALCVLVAAAAAVIPEVLGALVDEARIRHRAGMARLRSDAARRHPADPAGAR